MKSTISKTNFKKNLSTASYKSKMVILLITLITVFSIIALASCSKSASAANSSSQIVGYWISPPSSQDEFALVFYKNGTCATRGSTATYQYKINGKYLSFLNSKTKSVTAKYQFGISDEVLTLYKLNASSQPSGATSSLVKMTTSQIAEFKNENNLK